MLKLKTETQNFKLKIIFLGTPQFVQPIKQELKKHFFLVKLLKEADLAVVAAYGRILTKEELNLPKYGSLNVHPSLLPKYRGPSPIQTAILNNNKTSGITIIKMDEKADHGPIIYQESLDLSDSDNCDMLSKKMFLRASEILPQVIENVISGKIKLVEQNHSKATFTQHLTKEDGYFTINNPPSAEILDRMIRAYYLWPGVWTKWRVKSLESRVKEKIVKFLPGKQIQMEGKKPISFNDFLNGYPDFPLKNHHL